MEGALITEYGVRGTEYSVHVQSIHVVSEAFQPEKHCSIRYPALMRCDSVSIWVPYGVRLSCLPACNMPEGGTEGTALLQSSKPRM